MAVVGAGMAAATEWLNALAAGAEVVSVRRREPARRPLNVARPLFTKRGLAGFRATPRAERAALLRSFGEPSYPPGRGWDEPLERAARERRFRVAPELNGAEQVICATGFRRGYAHDPLLARLVDEHGLETEERWIVLDDDSTVPGAERPDPHARARRRPRPVGVPRRRHARRHEGRRPRLPTQDRVVSYTLRGRIETRLAAAVLPVLVAAALSPILHKWWPLELVGLMLAIGLALDVGVYHRLVPYQPGWYALPLGLLELGLTMAARALLELSAPLWPALAFFAGSGSCCRLLAHAGLPLLRLSWPEDGGELGRPGVALAGAAPLALLAVLGTAWAVEPPTVRLSAGVHKGPIVLDHAQTVVGEEGAVVEGGIVITADDVTVRDVTVRGGEHGIDVDNARERRARARRRRGRRARRDPRPPRPGRDPRLRDPLAARAPSCRGSTSPSASTCGRASSRAAPSSAGSRASSPTSRACWCGTTTSARRSCARSR